MENIQDNSVQEKQDLTIFTPKEQKLFELLSRRDEAGQLPRMLKGAVKVLRDSANPVRFAHSANTIRCIADELINRNNKGIKPDSLLKEEEFGKIREKFEEVLRASISKISNSEDKDETKQQANRLYDRLKSTLSYGVRTKKHQLLDLVGNRKSKIVPEKLQEAAEKLTEIYNYFTKVLHRHKENEPEFEDNWIFFQDFLILVVSEFFDIAKEIEPFLQQETISNERPK